MSFKADIKKPSSSGRDFLAFLDKEHSIASPSYNRWFVPPAALAIHLSIGMAYGFSVFWLPLSQQYGVKCTSAYEELFTNKCDWQISTLVYTYSLFFFFLGLSAATFGKWLEKAGPRKAGFVASILWPFGLVLGGIGIYIHQIFVLWIGAGVIGGVGLGIGYISPVSTLIKWFPDKRGLATGMAIMGFGGGAIIGAPLAVKLMNAFEAYPVLGIPHTLFVLASIFFVLMMSGSLAYRIPPLGWTPKGSATKGPSMGSQSSYYSFKNLQASGHVHVDNIHKIPQFWLVWVMVLMNVIAGVGIVGMSSVMLQEIFGGQLIGKPGVPYLALTSAEKKETALIGAGFVGFISIFNIAGRFGYGVLSDYIGRKATFALFFVIGSVMYSLIPTFGAEKNLPLFTMAFCVVVSFYGGNFAALPAYLADLFGTQFVGAIHGRVLTTWMIGGVVGPQIETYIRDAQIAKGVSHERAYDLTMYILSGMLVIGLITNFFVTPVNGKFFMTELELDAIRTGKKTDTLQAAEEADVEDRSSSSSDGSVAINVERNESESEDYDDASRDEPTAWKVVEGAALVTAWCAVMVPFAWGLSQTLMKAMHLFGH